MNSTANNGYIYLCEHTAPEAKRLLDQLVAKGVRYRLSIVDEIKRAWPWGHHGDYTRIAIFVSPEDLARAREIQEKLIKYEI